MTVAKKKSPPHARIPGGKGAAADSPAGVRWQNFSVGVFLILIVLAVFGPAAHFAFINYDDNTNIYENPSVENGLSLNGVGWAFTHVQVANWIPLTTLSHMLDCQLFGMNAGGHHLVNVLLHAATAVLLFLGLRQLTGSLWRSAFVAAVFTVHPLRVESVVWVSERKDVLSAFFFMLSLLAYARYAQGRSRIGAGATLNPQSLTRNYLLALFFFACGLLSKPMVATLPFVLLLLDCWPLQRFSISGFQFPVFLRLALEKIPFFLLAAASCLAVAFVPGLAVVPPPGMVTTGNDVLPLFERLGGALVSGAVYLRQLVFPAGLAIPYPDPPSGFPAWKICLALLLLAAISAGALFWRKKYPFLLVGWLWFLGMLAPVSGIVSISNYAAHADRYTYLPGIGLAFAGTWLLADLSAGWKHRRAILGGMMAVVIGTLMVCARAQTFYWRNSESLWTRTLAVTGANIVACDNLGNAYARAGRLPEAIAQYQRALAINPDYEGARNDLANVLLTAGQTQQAIAQYRKVLEINPGFFEARYNLAVELFQNGDMDGAIAQYRKVLEINPGAAQARNNLGVALYKKGLRDEAIVQYQKALATSPRYAEAHNNLGVAFMQAGRMAEAAEQYRAALEITPGYVDALNNLAWVLATAPSASLRDGIAALALSQKAIQSAGGENPVLLRTLAAAQAETGRYADAAESARHALRLAVAAGNSPLAGTLQQEINLYDAGSPVRDVKP
jgi:tetratricopeptide (TPR) repeat protein